MSQSSIIEKSFSDAFNVRPEVDEFIASINIELSNRIKRREGTHLASDDKIVDEEVIADFSNRKLSPRDEKYSNYYSKTQKWLGHVSEISDAGFKAKLEDLTNKGTYEIGEFELEEISEEDRPLAQIGAAFYWWIGYAYEKGQICKKSEVRFQRVLKWDEDYMNAATDRASRLATNLKWE